MTASQTAFAWRYEHNAWICEDENSWLYACIRSEGYKQYAARVYQRDPFEPTAPHVLRDVAFSGDLDGLREFAQRTISEIYQ